MKPILFIDFDGTLCHDRFWRSLDAEKYEAIQTHLMGENTQIVNDWMRGKYTSEEIHKILGADLGLSEEEIWDAFVNDCKAMDISMPTLEKIHSLRSNYYTVLITSNMDSFDRFTVPSLRLHNYFDKIVNSYTEGMLKTDNGGKQFVEVTESLGSLISDSIVIDNSLEVCSVFRNLGGVAYLVTGEKNLDYYLNQLSF